jgi:hypothetical protein
MTPHYMEKSCIYLFLVYFKVLSVTMTTQQWTVRWVWNNELKKGCERSGNSLIQGTILEFSWREWVTPRKTSAMIACLQAVIWTQDLTNTKQKCSQLNYKVWKIIPSYFNIIYLLHWTAVIQQTGSN